MTTCAVVRVEVVDAEGDGVVERAHPRADITAVGAAVTRGVHLLFDGEPKVFRDEYAIPLSGWTEQQVLDFAANPHRQPTSTWVTRSRLAEDRLAAARARDVQQYVILGAGLDSFALRHADGLGELFVYEVDDPPMQAWKRDRIEQLDLTLPAGVRFAPCDFETTTLEEALLDAGFAMDAPAVISWLGVTQYLSREAIMATLAWASRLPGGSEIIFTFVVPGRMAEENRERFAARGVRFETFFNPDEVGDLLTEAGLRAEVLTPESLDEMYFQDRDDGLRASRHEWLSIGHIL